MSVGWDGHSWTAAERAAEKMALRSPLFLIQSAGFLAVHATRRALTSVGTVSSQEPAFTDRTLTTQGQVRIEVSPEVAYAGVSDVTRMGSWSPENTGATLTDGDGDMRVGTVFHGHNRRGRLQWTTLCRVTEAEPGQRFAFDVEGIGPLDKPFLRLPIATWSYRFEPAPGGATTVTETWRVGPYPPSIIAAARRMRQDDLDAVELQGRNIRITLDNLKQVLESRDRA